MELGMVGFPPISIVVCVGRSYIRRDVRLRAGMSPSGGWLHPQADIQKDMPAAEKTAQVCLVYEVCSCSRGGTVVAVHLGKVPFGGRHAGARRYLFHIIAEAARRSQTPLRGLWGQNCPVFPGFAVPSSKQSVFLGGAGPVSAARKGGSYVRCSSSRISTSAGWLPSRAEADPARMVPPPSTRFSSVQRIPICSSISPVSAGEMPGGSSS